MCMKALKVLVLELKGLNVHCELVIDVDHD
jgi:hypothetical protein